MKQLITVNENVFYMRDHEDDSKVKTMHEIILALLEPQFRVDLGGQVVRETAIDTVRFVIEGSNLREFVTQLLSFLDDAEKDQPTLPLSTDK